MRDLDLLVPSCLVDPHLASDLLQAQTLPTLERIVARTGTAGRIALSPSASLTAWQAWVFGTRADQDPASVNVAELWAMACGLATPTKGARYVAEPAHFSIAKDHLRLDDPHGMDVTLAEARELASAIEPVLRDAGWRLDPIEPATLNHWMLFRDDATLSAAAIERAIGGNVAAWQPRAATRSGTDDVTHDAAHGTSTEAALAWRRCINEIQMVWFGHAVNEAREARGRTTINTLWLSGNGAPPSPMPHYATIDSSIPLLVALSIEPEATRSLETFDGFIAPTRAADWSGWREQLATFEARLAAIVDEQGRGTIASVALVLCGRDVARTLTFGPRDLGRFSGRFWQDWKQKPALGELFAEGRAA